MNNHITTRTSRTLFSMTLCACALLLAACGDSSINKMRADRF
ncbi:MULTISPECIES: hypothetical protein [Symbiopectobacterium]|nr:MULTISPECIES: hypothetical protein [Symbiopectobacterium]